MNIIENSLGTIMGNELTEYILENGRMQVSILNFGATIYRIMLPNKETGAPENVVLTRANLEDYVTKHRAFFGAIIGRTAGRIAQGKLRVGKTKNTYKQYEITKNRGEHASHGGYCGFSHKVFETLEMFVQEDKASLSLGYFSSAGEEGYPGNLDVKIVYTLDNENRLCIQMLGTPSAATCVNMTSHGYFNLSGDCKEDIFGHTVQILATEYLETGDEGIATGHVLDGTDTPLDYREERALEEGFGTGIDHCFLLSKEEAEVREAFSARLAHAESGRALEVYTNQPALVVFTDNKTNGEVLLHGIHKPHEGICFEAQRPTFGAGYEYMDVSTVEEGETSSQITVYKFVF